MAIERDTFLEVMASFPTGVAVITTLDGDDEPFGLTSNAVSSVSADPPMLLVCVAKTSRTLPALLARKGFLVNFMGTGSEQSCSLFASKADSAEKFEAVEWTTAESGHPILSDSIAYADCSTVSEIEAGSHIVLIGEVNEGGVTQPDRDPIAYFRRGYSSLTGKAA